MTGSATSPRKAADADASREYIGRRCTAEISFFVPVDATEDQIARYVEYELGTGSLPLDHPLIDRGVTRALVETVTITRRHLYIDWDDVADDGCLLGKCRWEDRA